MVLFFSQGVRGMLLIWSGGCVILGGLAALWPQRIWLQRLLSTSFAWWQWQVFGHLALKWYWGLLLLGAFGVGSLCCWLGYHWLRRHLYPRGGVTFLLGGLWLSSSISFWWLPVCYQQVLKWILIIGCAQVLSLVWSGGWLWWRSRRYPSQWPIVVLGAGLTRSGEVTRILASRLKLAQQAWQAAPRPIVVSGGQGPDEPCSEASAMAYWLVQHGIPATMIQLEKQATSTVENLKLSAQQLATSAVQIVTSDFHILRTSWLAQRQQLQVQFLAAPTPWWQLPSNLGRELVALVALNAWWLVISGVGLGWFALK